MPPKETRLIGAKEVHMALNSQDVKRGGEQHEYFTSARGDRRVQYDYRAIDGALFTCTAATLDRARAKKDRWLRSREKAAA
jgi:hypothetical protein